MTWFYESVQASQVEIHNALESVHAVEIQGSYRILEKSYLYSILKLVLLTCQEMDWNLESIPIQEMISNLSEQALLPQVTRQVLGYFALDPCLTLSTHVHLCLHKISRFIGEYLLLIENKNGMRLSLFMTEWKNRCPENAIPCMDHLHVNLNFKKPSRLTHS